LVVILQTKRSGVGLERLRSAVGEREKGSGGGVTAGTEPERNAAAEPQTEGRRFFGITRMSLVTSARFAKWNGRRREGIRNDGQPVERSKPRAGHGRINVVLMNNRLLTFQLQKL